MAEINTQFEALTRSYGLTSTRQIKERIIWKHVKLLMQHAYDTPETAKALAHYDTHWKILEEFENQQTKEKGH